MKVPGFNSVLSLAKDMSNNMISNSVYSSRNESFHDRRMLLPQQALHGVWVDCGPCLYHDEQEASLLHLGGQSCTLSGSLLRFVATIEDTSFLSAKFTNTLLKNSVLISV
jgi:hypothetical protein